MVTSAQFQFLSGWPNVLPVNAHGEHLQGEFPTPLVITPANPTPTNPVSLKADNSTYQSWVGLDFKKSSIGINLGRFAFDGGIRHSTGPPGQATAVIAPRDPWNANGWDYFIWVLAGPGKLQGTLNSIIRANTDAFVDFMKEQHPTFDMLGFSVRITSIKADQLGCTFATVSKQGQKTPWNMDLVLNFSGTVTAEIPVEGLKAKVELKVKNLSVQLGVTIDTITGPDKKPKVPDIYLHRLQLSVDSLEGLQPGSYYGPALLNSTKNKEVLEAINGKLNELLQKLGPLAPLEKYNLSSIPKTPPSLSSYQEWMSKPSIQAKRLGELKIPGTHDSAAYTFDKKISCILYDELQVLSNLRSDVKAPPGHKLNDLTNIYIGPEAYDDVIDNIALLGQAHHESKTIKKQLEDGIRYFDLRIYLDKDENEYYTQHTLRAPKLRDLIVQIREFLIQHKSSREFIIVEFGHSWFPKYEISNETDTVATLVSDELGPWCYMPSDAPRHLGPVFERYNLQKLQDLQLSSITDGGPKVLIVSSDECIYQHSVLNVDYDSLQNPKPGSKLSPHWFTEPPSDEDVIGHILLNTFDPSAQIKALQHAAYEKNATVKEVLARNPPAWRYMMDWYTESKSGELPIDLIIKANG